MAKSYFYCCACELPLDLWFVTTAELFLSLGAREEASTRTPTACAENWCIDISRYGEDVAEFVILPKCLQYISVALRKRLRLQQPELKLRGQRAIIVARFPPLLRRAPEVPPLGGPAALTTALLKICAGGAASRREICPGRVCRTMASM